MWAKLTMPVKENIIKKKKNLLATSPLIPNICFKLKKNKKKNYAKEYTIIKI